MPSKQGGAALVIAMLIVTVVVLLTVTLTSDFTVLFRKVENQLHSQQALAYMFGSEGLGRRAILQDTTDGPDIDHRNEGWLERDVPYVNDHAQIVGRVSDLQGRFGLNRLQNPAAKGTKYTNEQQHFIRLLQTLTLDTPLDVVAAEELTNGVIDWLDKDPSGIEVERSPGGAEDLFYGDAVPAGRAANRKMASVSELRWVKGFTEEIYRALAPHITVWETTGINVNTASENVLRSFGIAGDLNPLDSSQIQVLIEAQDEKQKGYENAADAFTAASLSSDIDQSLAVVKSEYFLLVSKVQLGKREYQLQSVLKREANKVSVVARSQSNL